MGGEAEDGACQSEAVRSWTVHIIQCCNGQRRACIFETTCGQRCGGARVASLESFLRTCDATPKPTMLIITSLVVAPGQSLRSPVLTA